MKVLDQHKEIPVGNYYLCGVLLANDAPVTAVVSRLNMPLGLAAHIQTKTL